MPSRIKKSSSKSKNSPINIGGKSLSLKQFRSDIAKLKKLGLVSHKIDARSVEPTKWYKSVLRNYSDVIQGEAKVISVNRQQKSKFKESGYRTKFNKAVIPVRKNETVTKTREGYKIRRKMQGGELITERVLVGHEKLAARLENMRHNPKYRLRNGQYIGFRYYGNNSVRLFTDIDDFINWFAHYDSVREAIETGNAEQEDDVIRNLELVKLNRDGAQMWEQEKREQRKLSKQNRNKERYNEYMRKRRANMSPEEKKIRAIKDKEYRDNMKKNDPLKYQEYLRKARERNKKRK